MEVDICSFIVNAVFIASPLMVLAAVMLAACRGELKELMKYEEDWSYIPEAQAEGIDVGEKPKETV